MQRTPSWEVKARFYVVKFSPFYVIRIFIRCSLELATGPYPEPHNSRPSHPIPPVLYQF